MVDSRYTEAIALLRKHEHVIGDEVAVSADGQILTQVDGRTLTHDEIYALAKKYAEDGSSASETL